MNRRVCILIVFSSLLSACSYMPSWLGGKTDEKPKLEGTRSVAYAVGVKLQPDPSLLNTPPVLPPVAMNTEVAQGYSTLPAGAGNLAGGKFDSSVSAKIGDGVDFPQPLAPSPVVAGEMVFAMDAAGNVSAHDNKDINKINWMSGVVANAKGTPSIGGGMAFDAGVLYVTTGEGVVAAFEAASGKLLWRKDFAVSLRAAPRVSGDRLIIVTMDSHTYALSAKDGEVMWDHRGINETAGMMNSVSPVVYGDGVVIPYSSGEIFALSLENGRELWGETLLKNRTIKAYGVFSGIGGDPVVDGGMIFATSNSGVFAALSAVGGQHVWTQQFGSLNTPWLAGDDLFVLTTDNILLDLEKNTGKIRWLTQLEQYENPELKLLPISWRGPILVDGNLLVVGSNGKMQKISALSGKIVDTIDVPSGISAAPVVAGGRLYLVDKKANIYSF